MRNKINEDKRRRLRQLVNLGRDPRDIARITGVTVQAVRALAKSAGITLPPCRRRKRLLITPGMAKKRREELRRLYESGMTVEEIAASICRTPATVYWHLSRANARKLNLRWELAEDELLLATIAKLSALVGRSDSRTVSRLVHLITQRTTAREVPMNERNLT